MDQQIQHILDSVGVSQPQGDPVEQIMSQVGQTPASTPQNVQAAQGALGSQDYNGYCETFVEHASGLPAMGGSAVEAFSNFAKNGQASTDLSQMKPGDLIYFAPDPSNRNFGHTGIYKGGNRFVSATYGGVQDNDLSDWVNQTGQQPLGFVPLGGSQ